ncbi:MAG: site-2 protease family protein [Candidatus Kerfeldbacteria bacterium CG15_BIG_FIL_POST_REV_8_21_14_020_45_12]|uniref:Site-2 protease family protein n=1 Tax=Candidatus Kerfeldbacteria bacterium CG15_BIG_FIL_POST_REV_8_21_14_020_45_12 TaxID=2014247 RepID=A0A2M7H2I0_9BACT|nr:MAG: site-2 protease family protein [Candidatus Kerfeldbacteria bacterium CG15_BIG_FIL_POST_REV_8_21_14_020_45_12]PJA93476.1 MAG: site-2 protease family protein [Candidatus Kerfeldbacteria bacterium CG_4_9_14_3_um_filter_45_8]
MLITSLFQEPVLVLLWLGAVIFALTVHEFSHALAGKLQGDPTAELEGRLTLNPLSHIDWIGFALLLIAGFGWAKPTPFNPYNLKYRKFGPVLVAFAGPISNLLAVVLFGVALRLVAQFTLLTPDNLLVIFLVFLMQINLMLALFNFIPIPPLDGSKVLYALIGERRPDIVQFLDRYGFYFLMALVFLFGDLISMLFDAVYGVVTGILF